MIRALGLMSGTSADGLDLALVEVDRLAPPCVVRLVASGFAPHPVALQERLLALQECGSVEELGELDAALSVLWAEQVRRFAVEHGLDLRGVQVVGSHGQTVRHRAPGRTLRPEQRPFTLQIGDGSVLAQELGLPVACDFRVADVAVGGQGAPLVPFFDWLVFTHPARDRAFLNLGGIANLTLLPAGAAAEQVTGFDTGPANMVSDSVARLLSGGALRYDAGGELAASAEPHAGLLAELLRHPYIELAPPKSTGREEFGEPFARELISGGQALGLGREQMLATAVAFTVESIALHLERFAPSGFRAREVIAGGGGVHNRALLAGLRSRLAPAEVLLADDFGVPAAAKEAMAFALLGAATLAQVPGNLPSVTGARRAVVLGKLCRP